MFTFILFVKIFELLLRKSKECTKLPPVWPKSFWKVSELVVGNWYGPRTAGFLHLSCNVNICTCNEHELFWTVLLTVPGIYLFKLILVRRWIVWNCPEIGYCCSWIWWQLEKTRGVIAELSRTQSSGSGAPCVKKSIHPRKFGNHVTVHRPPERPSVRTTGKPMFNLTLSNYFESPGQPDIAHPCCDQLTVVKTGYPLTSITWPYCRLRCPSWSSSFLKLSPDKVLVFKWAQAQVR